MAKHQAEEFFSIDVASLRAGEPVTFEVYLYLPLNEHVVKLVNAADIVDEQFLERFRKRDIRQFHVKNKDHTNYMEYVKAKTPNPTPQTDSSVSAPAPDAATPSTPETAVAPKSEEEKVPTLDDVIPFVPDIPPEQIFKDLLLGGEAEAKKATEDAEKIVDQLLEDSSSQTAAVVANATYDHANSVAIYSVLFAMGIGINDKALLQDFVAASMIHDIGLSQLPPSACKVPMTKLEGKAKELYESHAMYTATLADDMQFPLSKRARIIVEQHHEKFNGSGFPKKLEGFHIADHAQILGLSELIDSMCRGYYDGTKYTLNEAIALVCSIEKQTTFPQYFNPDIFKKVMLWIRKGSGLDYIEQATTVVNEARQQILDDKTAA